MTKLLNLKNLLIAATSLVLLFAFASAHAHHSFAIYDIENSIEIKGKLTRYDFIQPHVKMILEVTLDNGEKESWAIESMAPRRWKSFDLDQEFVAVGDQITLLGWPARNGGKSMALGTITGEKGSMVVRDRIRQRSATDAAGTTDTTRRGNGGMAMGGTRDADSE